jgi:hypothetical protein
VTTYAYSTGMSMAMDFQNQHVTWNNDTIVFGRIPWSLTVEAWGQSMERSAYSASHQIPGCYEVGEMETAIVEAGGCAAEMRTAAEWAEHPQGCSVAAEPLAHIAASDAAPCPGWPVPPSRPRGV